MPRLKNSVFCPNYAVPPGETLKETLEFMGISEDELARQTGYPIKTIREINRGKTVITPQTATKLESALGVPASFWTNLERNYRKMLLRFKRARTSKEDCSDNTNERSGEPAK